MAKNTEGSTEAAGSDGLTKKDLLLGLAICGLLANGRSDPETPVQVAELVATAKKVAAAAAK